MRRKLRMGMIGGGNDSFIGEVHRMASRLDNKIEWVCGCLSSNSKKAAESAKSLNLGDDRSYSTFQEMISYEKSRTENERMDFVSIVTPNNFHYEPAKMALENGFHVIIDKPLCFNLQQAYDLANLVKTSKLRFAVTYTYTGYPMVKEARHLIRQNTFGKIRKVDVEYPQGWLSTSIEKVKQKQASWRTDPAKTGLSGAFGDIGTHAENMAYYLTGLEIEELCADLKIFVEGRKVDDDGSVLIRYKNGATGTIRASQVNAGDENNLKITVSGEKGGLEWSHKDPSSLIVKWLDAPNQVFRAGANNEYLSQYARNHCRLPAGHPEGFIEAFANIYRNFAMAVESDLDNSIHDFDSYDFPTVIDGLRGMAFVDSVVRSSQDGGKWIKFGIDN